MSSFPADTKQKFEALKDAEISDAGFSFYTSVSSVYSSKIEGEQIELDSYIKHRQMQASFLPGYTRKIDDLYSAYTFAQQHELTPEGLLRAHGQISEHLLNAHQRGQYRKNNMYVSTPDGRIEYVAASPEQIEGEMEKFCTDFGVLLNSPMAFAEVFYFAAMLHLVLVKIHPFYDGNGRTARLLEKWFLAEKLGEKAWFVQSERYYYQHHDAYYRNIRRLGLEYDALDYTQAGAFLEMLAGSVGV